MNKIKLFVTGGTFDKEYNPLNGSLYFKETHLSEMIEMSRATLDVEVETLMMMDSLDMQAEHREKIATACLETEEKRVIVTHGTDTMVETAAVIADRVKDKTVILTGAMIPYKFGSSDGFFNVGAALAFVQTLPKGVYVCMNGKYFDWDKVRKNKEVGVFEAL